MTINVVYRVRCSGPCRRWLSLPDGYEPGEDFPLAALEPQSEPPTNNAPTSAPSAPRPNPAPGTPQPERTRT